NIEAVGGLERAVRLGDGELGDVAGEHVVLEAGEFVELGGGLLELLVLEELVDEFPAGVEGVVVAAFGDGGLAAGEEHAAFDLHEGGGHDEELAGDVEVELLERVEHVDVLAGDRLEDRKSTRLNSSHVKS